MSRQAEHIQALIEPVVAALGYELIGVEYLPQGKHSLLRVYIDSEEGVSVDDCERVSHQVSGILDVEDPIHGRYTLEVSSPGLDRPLFTGAQYERFAGSTVRIRLKTLTGGRRKYTGMLMGFRDGNVVLREDSEEVLIPLERIEKANVVPQW